MPNLVVYIPAGLWKRFEEVAGADAKNQIRSVVTQSAKDWINEIVLNEREVAEKAPVSVTVEPASADRGGKRPDGMAGPVGSPAPPLVEDDHFKPDFGKKLK